VTYLGFLAMIFAAILLLYRATLRGVLWVAPVQHVIMNIPRLGPTLQVLALARLSWALHVTLNSGMDLRPALKMSLASTHNVFYTRHIDGVLKSIRSGQEIHEALAKTNVFPIDFLDSVRVGEESGQLVESMANLSEQYQDQARLAMNTLTILMGLAVTGLVAGVIIFLIFRVFGFYMQTINDALKMKP
jgi:type II secretory pathway component PulF